MQAFNQLVLCGVARTQLLAKAALMRRAAALAALSNGSSR